MVQTHNTERLFYGKWIYKICCRVEHGSAYRWPGSSKFPLIFANSFKEFLDKDIQYRVEGTNFNIFCNDAELFQAMFTKLSPWVYSTYSPKNEEERQFLLGHNQKKIIKNRYFKNQFRFKIYLKKLKNDVRTSLNEWLKKYPDKYYFSGDTVDYLSGKYYFVSNPFIYVKDEHSLSMIYLYLGTGIKSTEEFVLRNNINTVSCQL